MDKVFIIIVKANIKPEYEQYKSRPLPLTLACIAGGYKAASRPQPLKTASYAGYLDP